MAGFSVNIKFRFQFKFSAYRQFSVPKSATSPICCYVQGYETASKRAFVISIAFGLMSQPIKFRFNSLQTTAVVPEPK